MEHYKSGDAARFKTEVICVSWMNNVVAVVVVNKHIVEVLRGPYDQGEEKRKALR